MFRWIGCAEMIYSGKRTCKRTDCLYYSPKVDYNGCDYMYLTGIPRSCPKGADCIRYKYATAIAINFFHREENTDGKQDKQED